MTDTTASAQWQIVQQRQATKAFYYAVKTTGIYCRPGCASRLPNRNNVEFFNTAQDAIRAGYRACKKCGNDNSTSKAWIIHACQTLRESAEVPSLQELAMAANISARHFHRTFKLHTGVTPKQYAQAVRRSRWQKQLTAKGKITDAIYDSGFNSGARAYENTAADLGMTPSIYKKGGEGERIQYAVSRCELGQFLVAATARGICKIDFGESAATLRTNLTKQFYSASLVAGDEKFCQTIQKIARHFNSPQSNFKLPLDIRGTAFQQQVWHVLQKIPTGETLTYSQLATKIGNPTAVRAVATACAKNPVAVLVPCHRIVGKDKNLRGYRWGLERKQALLARENTSPTLTKKI